MMKENTVRDRRVWLPIVDQWCRPVTRAWENNPLSSFLAAGDVSPRETYVAEAQTSPPGETSAQVVKQMSLLAGSVARVCLIFTLSWETRLLIMTGGNSDVELHTEPNQMYKFL